MGSVQMVLDSFSLLLVRYIFGLVLIKWSFILTFVMGSRVCVYKDCLKWLEKWGRIYHHIHL